MLLQFDKPGARDNSDYPDMAKEAGALSSLIMDIVQPSKNHIWVSLMDLIV